MNINDCHQFINDVIDAPETKKSKKTYNAVYKKLCKVMDGMGLEDLTFYTERDPAFVSARITGEDMKINLYVSVDIVYREVMLISMFPDNYKEAAENNLIKACNLINGRLMFGYFNVDTENFVISYNSIVLYDDKGIDEDLLKYQIINACSTVDIYSGLLMRLSEGGEYADFLNEVKELAE